MKDNNNDNVIPFNPALKNVEKSFNDLKALEGKTEAMELIIETIANDLFELLLALSMAEKFIDRDNLKTFNLSQIKEAGDLIDEAEYILKGEILKPK